MNTRYQHCAQEKTWLRLTSLIDRLLMWVASSLIITMLLSQVAVANPPGEDTVNITNAKTNGIPGNTQQPGKGMPERADMPIYVKAKVARYTAVAMQKPEQYGNSVNVEQMAESAGFTKTCIQDVGSNTVTASGAGAGANGNTLNQRAQDQIVVLRGDLINICR